MTYRRLIPEEIVNTAERLSQRVSERFPGSGLTRVCAELLDVARKASVTSEWIEKPTIWLRIVVAALILFIVIALVFTFISIRVRFGSESLVSILQGIEAGINDVIFVFIAVWSLVTLENRMKRKRALKALHELRSMAHIIDMHQLTKDPERVMNFGENTPSSPSRKMSGFELRRYLDYCSEMLSIISKISAVYVQNYDDSVTLAAVNEIETLTTGLSRKIWHKISILEHLKPMMPTEPGSDD